jgi:hypothetical protein
MNRAVARFLLLLLCLAASCGVLAAQDETIISLRMLDGKTGTLIATSSFLVRVNHEEEIHGNWVKQNEDGTGKLTLPHYATELSIHATYESATSIYVNCDSDKERPSAEHAVGIDHWYSVQSILTAGVVAPNNCAGKKIPERLQVVAKPGEFVFFVRPLNAREQMKD